jgi:hypothetical protein
LVGGRGGGGDGEDELGDEDFRTRRDEMMESSASSYGRTNSLRKKGCRERLSDGEGESMVLGVECEELGDSKPSASWIKGGEEGGKSQHISKQYTLQLGSFFGGETYKIL